MRKITITAINQKIGNNPTQFVAECRNRYMDRLTKIADSIEEQHKEKPILLLAGPSGSGKTTSALKIEQMLDNRGIHTHTISLDDYFLPADKYREKYGDGEPDYEAPDRIDNELLADHIEKISNCEKVTLPDFQFSTQSRRNGAVLERKCDDIVVFEGIHALNPAVTGQENSFARCMYVSVRTRLELNDGRLLHPSYIRLMRRILRDGAYRGRSIAETLNIFDKVEAGENKFIMPFKHRAEFSVDTFQPTEPCVYKHLLIDELEETAKSYKDFQRFSIMLDALHELDTISPEYIPSDSLIREFIGGSSFTY